MKIKLLAALLLACLGCQSNSDPVDYANAVTNAFPNQSFS